LVLELDDGAARQRGEAGVDAKDVPCPVETGKTSKSDDHRQAVDGTAPLRETWRGG
jgi:hypothetical protein